MNHNTGKSRMAFLHGSSVSRVGSANAFRFSIIDCMVSTGTSSTLAETDTVFVGAHVHDKAM